MVSSNIFASVFRFTLSLVCCVGLVVLSGCQAGSNAGPTVGAIPGNGDEVAGAAPRFSSEPIKGDEAIVMALGLSCPLCANNIESTLKKLPGVQRVEIDLSSGKILVAVFGKARPSKASLAKAVTDAGFTVVSVS